MNGLFTTCVAKDTCLVIDVEIVNITVTCIVSSFLNTSEK